MGPTAVRVRERVSHGGRVVSLSLSPCLLPVPSLSLWSATGVLVVLYIGQNRYVPLSTQLTKAHPTAATSHYEPLRPPPTPTARPPLTPANPPIHANTTYCPLTVLSLSSHWPLLWSNLWSTCSSTCFYYCALHSTPGTRLWPTKVTAANQCPPTANPVSAPSSTPGWLDATRIASLSYSPLWKSSPEATTPLGESPS